MNSPAFEQTSPICGQVIVVTGPPRSGKTTVAALLADRLDPSVHLRSDDFWHYIKQGWTPPYLPEAHRQNQVVLEVLVSAAFGYASGGYHVVYDGVVGPWFIDLFRAATKEQAIPVSYVILRPNQQTTVERATGRAGDALTDPEPIRSMHDEFSDLGVCETNVLDSSNLTAAATADSILESLARDAYLLDPDDSTNRGDDSIHNS